LKIQNQNRIKVDLFEGCRVEAFYSSEVNNELLDKSLKLRALEI